MKFGIATDKRFGRDDVLRRRSGLARRLCCRDCGFTLVEVLAALMLMAILIPVVVEALNVASLSGEVATRRAEATRVADSVLNENIVTTNWTSSLSGTVFEGTHQFRWTMNSEPWSEDSAMQMVTAEVKFTAQGRDYSVRLNTLAMLPTLTATATTGQ